MARSLKALLALAVAAAAIQLPAALGATERANAHKCAAKVRAKGGPRHKVEVTVWCRHPEPGGASVLVTARRPQQGHSPQPHAVVGFWRHPVPVGSTNITDASCRGAHDPVYAMSCRATTQEAAGFKFVVRLKKAAYCRSQIEVAQPMPAVGPEGVPVPPALSYWVLYRELPQGCSGN